MERSNNYNVYGRHTKEVSELPTIFLVPGGRSKNQIRYTFLSNDVKRLTTIFLPFLVFIFYILIYI